MYTESFCVVCVGSGMAVAGGISDRGDSALPSSPVYFERSHRYELFENGKTRDGMNQS